jgi:hypothetical protein
MATWNIRTTFQLEKTMEMMNKLDKYNIDVASLQGIRTRTNRYKFHQYTVAPVYEVGNLALAS